MLPERFIRQIPLFLLALFLSIRSGGQTDTLKRSIEWTPVSTMSIDGQVHKILHFQNASYNLNTLLPNYYEIIKLENNSEYTVKLINRVFRDADMETLGAIDETEEIGDDIRMESRIAGISHQNCLQLSFIPLRRNRETGRIELLLSFDLLLQSTALPGKKSTLPEYADHSVLATGKWVKIKVIRDGIYRLSYEQLRNLGIDNPSMVHVYGNRGGMLSMMVTAERPDDLYELNISNRGDNILFYGQSPNTWTYDSIEGFFNMQMHDYADATYYFLTSGPEAGSRVGLEDIPQGDPGHVSRTVDALYHHEIEDINLFKSGREWYGEHFDIVTDQGFEFNIPGLRTTENIQLKVQGIGRANGTTSMVVSTGGVQLGSLIFSSVDPGSYSGAYAREDTEYFTFQSSVEKPEIRLKYIKNNSSAEGWLNYITLNARTAPVLKDNFLIFRDKNSVSPGMITEFRLQDIGGENEVWDISDPIRPVRIQTSEDGQELTFKTATDELKEFIVFNPSSGTLQPVTEGEDVGPVPNQDLHALDARNYLIVSHPEFIDYARILAAHRHDHDGLDTAVVTPQQIYNEFSSGSPDVSAIRNFLKMLYDRAPTTDEMPRYVLLFGDGSYDNRSKDVNNTNYILTYQSDNSIYPTSSYVTDDFFGLLDEGEGKSSGLVDIGIGRFPVSSREEAENVLNKTLSYDEKNKMGDWRNSICFIGDDEDGNIHMSQADELARYVEENYPNFTIGKIYLDSYTQVSTPSGERYPDVNAAITRKVEKGELIVNYTGHGGAKGLAHERVVRIEDVQSWKNADRLPLFITATCEFSRFDEYESASAGELVLLNPAGGGVALLTTTRLVYSAPNHTLNKRFYEYVFEKDDKNRNYRLGDILRLTKNTAGSSNNKRNFTLLGDPALELAYPRYSIGVDSINSTSVSESVDTLKALAEVSISGYLEDQSGSLLEGFNGVVFPTVIDKSSTLTTLNNDDIPAGPMTYTDQSRILYKGQATVANGRFRFSFVVPKDITYNYDFGKLSFYAENGMDDASGSFASAIIGGSEGEAASDYEGPELSLYMNNDRFVDGGITDADPVLLVFVRDMNGINTLGNGIGHDITAIVDDDFSQSTVLNDYYEADQDSYQSGKIRYSLKELEPGRHNIRVKVWDVHNNSSVGTIEFLVTESPDLIIEQLMNYPNPFSEDTRFSFEHNQPDMDLDVRIQIYSMTGQLMKTIRHAEPASGYRVGPISWDGTGDHGSRLSRGIYIYRVIAKGSAGLHSEKSGKLVIID